MPIGWNAMGFGWGWFTVLGTTLMVLGALAFLGLPPAGDTSVSAIGMFMLIGAFEQLGTRRAADIGPAGAPARS